MTITPDTKKWLKLVGVGFIVAALLTNTYVYIVRTFQYG